MHKINLYEIYANELITWNQKFNLTAITDPKEIEIKHFEDSRTVLQAVDLIDQKIIDIGTGAGFPGIPLKIERPNIRLTLVEATRKKCEFLKHLVTKLSAIDPRLQDIEIVWGRAEKLNQDPKYKGKFDVAVARAVAKLDRLINYALPFLRPGGTLVAMKGPEAEKEIKLSQEKFVETAKNKKNYVFGKLSLKIIKSKLSNHNQRSLVIYQT